MFYVKGEPKNTRECLRVVTSTPGFRNRGCEFGVAVERDKSIFFQGGKTAFRLGLFICLRDFV
ncbi:hypothetical protein EPI10_022095 [Gossypium australe]|uniref:Uncharacterized protein n=1 Tax=Gossypium australe TaxID=47621 RepID=A0A5B6WKP9_9ROSI|nr:hypothetical protein EPI10_022095 [Gossypium australe]